MLGTVNMVNGYYVITALCIDMVKKLIQLKYGIAFPPRTGVTLFTPLHICSSSGQEAAMNHD
jgi:hypothetical protein